MNYKLAKELKDNNFPQRVWPESLVYLDETKVGVWGTFSQSVHKENGEMVSIQDFVKVPTLSELIEACGDRFSYLHQDSTRTWAANSHAEGDMEVYGEERGVGSIPEEAVARLWLALNKK